MTPVITRAQVIQTFLDLFPNPTYLEVGVFDGYTFKDIRAARKVAVDPMFRFDWQSVQDPTAEFHQIPSDEYFGKVVSLNTRFDVIYLDGLHTFEQTLRDLNNAIFFVKENGIIVIDDILPNSYAASLPDQNLAYAVKNVLKDNDISWMGDVYKLGYFIDTFFQQFSFSTIIENHGQLVMWRKRRERVDERQVGKIADLQFADLIANHSPLRIRHFADILNEVKTAVASGSV